MKKMKYQITVKSYIWMEAKTKDEEKLIKDMNNEFDKEKKKNRTYRKNTVSADMLLDEYMYELPDNSPTILETIIARDKNREIHLAIKKLPNRQKETIIEHFYNAKSLRQIAREKHLNEKTIRESYHAALKNLKKMIKN